MNYDNVDKFNLRNIGIAYVIEKKQFTKDKKATTYYEIIDCVHGFALKYRMGTLFESCSKSKIFSRWLQNLQ